MLPKSPFLLLSILVTGLVILAVIAFYSSSLSSNASKEKFLPSLGIELNNLTHIHIVAGKEEVHLDNNNNFWQVRERANAPANLGYIRILLRALTESTLTKAKTKDPNRYNKLGLDESQSSHLRLYTKDNKEPTFDIYLGTALPKQESTYARIQGNPESWLISGIIRPIANPDQWIDSQFLSIAPSRIKTLILSTQGIPIHIERDTAEEQNFILKNIPTGYKIHSQLDINQLAEIVQEVSSKDTLPLAKVNFDKNQASSVKIITFDRMEITIKIASIKEGKFAAYTFKYNPDTNDDPKQISYRQQQSAAYTLLTKGKAYRISDAFFALSTQTLAQFIEKQ